MSGDAGVQEAIPKRDPTADLPEGAFGRTSFQRELPEILVQ